VIENWGRHYNTVRPHSLLGYRPPAPEVFVCPAQNLGPTYGPGKFSDAQKEYTNRDRQAKFL
jgi:hypothetical protein